MNKDPELVRPLRLALGKYCLEYTMLCHAFETHLCVHCTTGAGRIFVPESHVSETMVGPLIDRMNQYLLANNDLLIHLNDLSPDFYRCLDFFFGSADKWICNVNNEHKLGKQWLATGAICVPANVRQVRGIALQVVRGAMPIEWEQHAKNLTSYRRNLESIESAWRRVRPKRQAAWALEPLKEDHTPNQSLVKLVREGEILQTYKCLKSGMFLIDPEYIDDGPSREWHIGPRYYVPTQEDVARLEELFPDEDPLWPNWLLLESKLVGQGEDPDAIRCWRASVLITKAWGGEFGELAKSNVFEAEGKGLAQSQKRGRPRLSKKEQRKRRNLVRDAFDGEVPKGVTRRAMESALAAYSGGKLPRRACVTIAKWIDGQGKGNIQSYLDAHYGVDQADR